jgi:diguanylate cyclase (GGDEF)-like protein/PAS domain S-box-containing protein
MSNKTFKIILEYAWKTLVLVIAGFVFVSTGDFYGISVETIPLVWLPGGIFIALVYFWGYRFLPGVYLSVLIAFLLTGRGLPLAPLAAAIATLESVIGCLLLKRAFRVNHSLISFKDVIGLLSASILASFTSAGLYSILYSVVGTADDFLILFSWGFWWINGLLGILLQLPIIMVWGTDQTNDISKQNRRWDWIAVLIVFCITWLIFRQKDQTDILFNYQSYLLFPFILWIALRLLQRGITLTNLGISLVAITAVYRYETSFVHDGFSNIWILGAFLIVVSMTSMVLAALFAERESATNNLMEANVKLEERVALRTQELKAINSKLKHELKTRQSVETELVASEEKLRTLVDNIPEALFLMSAHANIMDVNNKLLSMYGVSRDEIINFYKLEDFLSPDLPAQELDQYHQRALNGEAVTFEWIARRPSDNFTFPVEIKTKRIWYDNEKCLIGSIRDLTERNEIMHAEHEQRILAEALQNTAAALSSSVQNLDEVFDKILKNVGNVIPHDAVNLMLIDEDGVGRIVHSHGYRKLGMQTYIQDMRFDVNLFRNLRVMVETGLPVIIPDVSNYPEWVFDERVGWIQSYAGVPIRVKDVTIGFIQLDSGTSGHFKKEHSARLQAFANQAAIAIENARLYTELQKLAITDPLTGLLNRHGFNPTSKREFEIAKRYNHKITALMFDIDHLKNINDDFGHPVGDRSLKMIAECCRTTIREIDLAARFGGDEFVILLSETDVKTGMEVAERLRRCIRAHWFKVDGKEVEVTISAGAAELRKNMHSLDDLLDMADRGSYLAKSQGRDSIATVQTIPGRIRTGKHSD